MLSLPRNTRIYVHLPPTDLRMSFNGLSGLVRSAFAADLLEGGWFLFLNKRRDRIKILYWDRDGLALWYKRLEAGTFEQLRAVADLEGMDAIEPHAAVVAAVGLEIRQRRRMAAGVPFLAVHRAGVTTDAGVEVDHQAELLRAGLGLRIAGHRGVFAL